MAKSAVMPGEDVAVPEIFARFQWFEGLVKWRYYPSPLGALMDQRFNYEDEELAHLPTEGTWHFERSLPRIDEEIFEWIDVLECVEAARGRFTMVELGAGYGRWLLAGAMAARQRSLPFHLVGVEAEPRHFAWLKQHLRDNDIDPAAHTLIEAPVSGRRERVRFYVGDPKKWYGQSITTHMAPEVNGASIVEMDSITLADVLRPLGKVDLIDMDIQGAEHDVLA